MHKLTHTKTKSTRPNNFSEGDPAAENQNQHLVTWKFKKKKKRFTHPSFSVPKGTIQIKPI